MDITVTITEPEIKEAICDYLFKHEVISKNKEIEVNMVAGRGTNGHSAVISVKNAIPTLVQITPPQAYNALKADKEASEHPAQDNPALYKQQDTPSEPVIQKDVPMPGAPKETAVEPAKASDEEITAQTTEGLANLFGDPEVPTAVPASTDPNDISEGTPNQVESVDSLFN